MPYTTTIIVRFGDVDSAGIVYYPRYPHYLHIGMERFFSDVVGIDYAELVTERQYGLPTVRLEVDYKKPLRYGDRIEMSIAIGKVGTTSVEWLYELRRQSDGELCATARTVTVSTNLAELQKLPIPDWLRQALVAGQEGDR